MIDEDAIYIRLLRNLDSSKMFNFVLWKTFLKENEKSYFILLQKLKELGI